MDATRNRGIYESEMRDWLPERILDAHVHLFLRESFAPGFSPPPHSYMQRLRRSSYTIEDCLADAESILPGLTFHGLCFGTPSYDPDRDHANRYIAGVCDNRRFFGLALVSPEDPVERVHQWLSETPLLGYKPYRDFVSGKPREAVTIHDMLPAPLMALADRLGLLVMLHIPRAGRLADPDNQREILELADRYPNASIVLAHIGRAYALKTVVGHLDRLRTRPNLHVDLAMLNHWEVLEYTFREFPRDRILFGTDMPVSCLAGKSVEINNQYAYIMEADVDIGTSIHDARHAVDFTYFYYEELRAIRKAAEKAGLSRPELQAIFHDNAMRLLQTTIARKAGSR